MTNTSQKYFNSNFKNICLKQKVQSWSSNNITTAYGKPKTHKHNYLPRSIISSVGLYNHELSKYLAELVKSN